MAIKSPSKPQPWANEGPSASSLAHLASLTKHKERILNCLSDSGLSEVIRLRNQYDRLKRLNQRLKGEKRRAQIKHGNSEKQRFPYSIKASRILPDILAIQLQGLNEVSSPKLRKELFCAVRPFAEQRWRAMVRLPKIAAVWEDLCADFEPRQDDPNAPFTKSSVGTGFAAGNTGTKRKRFSMAEAVERGIPRDEPLKPVKELIQCILTQHADFPDINWRHVLAYQSLLERKWSILQLPLSGRICSPETFPDDAVLKAKKHADAFVTLWQNSAESFWSLEIDMSRIADLIGQPLELPTELVKKAIPESHLVALAMFCDDLTPNDLADCYLSLGSSRWKAALRDGRQGEQCAQFVVLSDEEFLCLVAYLRGCAQRRERPTVSPDQILSIPVVLIPELARVIERERRYLLAFRNKIDSHFSAMSRLSTMSVELGQLPSLHARQSQQNNQCFEKFRAMRRAIGKFGQLLVTALQEGISPDEVAGFTLRRLFEFADKAHKLDAADRTCLAKFLPKQRLEHS